MVVQPGARPGVAGTFAGEMRSRLVLDEVVESACALPTLLHYVDEMTQALGLKLYAQERHLGLDPRRHLLLQRRSRFEEHRDAQDERRSGEHGDVKCREPKACDPQ
jgi:hypothetical protein